MFIEDCSVDFIVLVGVIWFFVNDMVKWMQFLLDIV